LPVKPSQVPGHPGVGANRWAATRRKEGGDVHMTETIKLNFYGDEYEIVVRTATYQNNGNTAVILDTVDGEGFAYLSANMDVKLPAGHFRLKDYSENESLVADPKIQALYSACAEHGPENNGYVTLSCHILKA